MPNVAVARRIRHLERRIAAAKKGRDEARRKRDRSLAARYARVLKKYERELALLREDIRRGRAPREDEVKKDEVKKAKKDEAPRRASKVQKAWKAADRKKIMARRKYWHRKHEAYVKKMWEKTLFSKERVRYEKLARSAARKVFRLTALLRQFTASEAQILAALGKKRARGKDAGARPRAGARIRLPAAARARIELKHKAARNMRALAARARARRDYAASQRHEDQAERLEQQARSEQINEGAKRAVEWSPTTDSEHVAPKAGSRDPEGGGAPERSSAPEDDADGGKGGKSSEEPDSGGSEKDTEDSPSVPLYRRPLVWFAGVVVVGGLIVFSRVRGKGAFKIDVRGSKRSGGGPRAAFRLKRSVAA